MGNSPIKNVPLGKNLKRKHDIDKQTWGITHTPLESGRTRLQHCGMEYPIWGLSLLVQNKTGGTLHHDNAVGV